MEVTPDGTGGLALRDGTPAWWRYVGPGDRAEFEAGLASLSQASRHRHFGHVVPDADDRPADMWNRLFGGVDQRTHVAVALYVGGAPVAVCHVIRLPQDVTTADVAVTVADDWQGRGAGGVLLRTALSLVPDVRRIDTQVMLANVAAVQMLQSLGDIEIECVQGHCRVIVELAERNPHAV